MSILKNCIRYSWEVAQNPNHGWGGVNDLTVEKMVRGRISLGDDYKLPVVDKSPTFYQVTVPSILMLRNTQHPLILERNFFWDCDESRRSYYPKDWGKFLTTEERDSIQSALRIKPEHRFVLYLAENFIQERAYISQLVMTHAFTTYTVPIVISLDELAKVYSEDNRGDNSDKIGELTSSPLLIVSSVFGACDKLKFTSGAITTLFKERMYNGRTTVFVDSGKVNYSVAPSELPEDFANKSRMTKMSLHSFIKNYNDVGINVTQLHSFFFGGMTYVMDVKSFAEGYHTSIE